MSSLDGQAIEQLTIAVRELKETSDRQFALIERQFALFAPAHQQLYELSERNIQAVETFGQTVANLVEQEGQLQAEVTRLDKAIDATHAANQEAR